MMCFFVFSIIYLLYYMYFIILFCRFEYIRYFVYFLEIVLDDSIGCVVWFVVRGEGILGNGDYVGKLYKSSLKVSLDFFRIVCLLD